MSRVDKPDKTVRRKVNNQAKQDMRGATTRDKWFDASDSYISTQKGNWVTEREAQRLWPD
jgi:hypothetical protein